ncbi:MAG: PAS domain S-box protein [Syntrophomonadaceae bacterium]
MLQRFSSRFIIYITIMLLVVCGGLGIVSYCSASRTVLNKIQQNLTGQAQLGTALVAAGIESRLNTLDAIAQRPEIRSMVWEEQLPVLQQESQRLGYLRMGVAKSDGILRLSNGSDCSITTRDYFYKALAGECSISNPVVSNADGSIVLMMAAPIFNYHGEIAGVLTATLDGAELNRLVEEIKVADTGYAFMLDEFGTTISHPDKTKVFEQENIIALSALDPRLESLADMERQMLTRSVGYGTYWFQGQDKVMGFAPVPGTKWSLAVVVPKEEMMTDIKSIRIEIIFATLLFMGLGFGLLLRKSEEKYRVLFNTMNEGFAVAEEISGTDGQTDYRLLEVNPAFEKITGIKTNQVVGRTIGHITLEGSECLRSVLRNVTATGEPAMLTHGFPDMGGKYFEISVYSTEKKKCAVIFKDVTDRKLAEKALHESEANYRTIFETAGAAMIICDQDTLINLANAEFENLSGYSKEEIQNKMRWISFVTKGDKERILDIHNLWRVDSNSAPRSYEFNFQNRKGMVRNVLINVALIPGTTRNVASFIDITDRKKMEKEISRLDQLNVVGQLSASIGHEIRNPMTSVRGFLQILRNDENRDPKEKAYFDLMIEEIDRANSIITEFLSLAKNKTVNLKLHNLNTIVESISPLIIADAREQDKYVEFQLGNVPYLFLDEKEIRQLVLNLARNGLEAMQPGKNLIIKTYEEEGETVLSVIDEGTGIDSEVIDKIGVPFFTTKEKGTGLGLSVCYSIAARHKAVIEIMTSRKGTCFKVRFKRRLM